MKLKFEIFLILIIAANSVLTGQVPTFKKHSINDAFYNVEIKLMLEDENSLLWFGTNEGLFHYEGINFIPYPLEPRKKLAVTALFQRSNSKIWVGFENGTLATFNPEIQNSWLELKDTLGAAITGFTEDKNHHMWVTTYGAGVFVHDGELLNKLKFPENNLVEDIYCIVKDKKDQIYLGTDSGIAVCNADEKSTQINWITKADGLPDEIVTTLKPDSGGNIWVGMFDSGICYYDVDSRKFIKTKDEFNGGVVRSLEIFDEQEIWIGTERQGVWRYDLHDHLFKKIQTSNELIGQKIYDLHKDIEGNIWVLSNDQGLLHANRQFESLETPFENIQSVLVDAENTMWIGTQKGLFIYKDNFFIEILPNLRLNVISLFQDKYDNIWIGSFGKGIFCYQKKSGRLRNLTEKEGLSNNSILSINGDLQNIWMATLGGVTCYESDANILEINDPGFKHFNQESGLGTNFIYNVFVDSKSRVWFASDGKGISMYDNGQFTNYSHAYPKNTSDSIQNGIPLKAVYTIAEDKRGHIWLSTVEEGIFEFNGDFFHQLAVKEGIRDLEISSLIADVKGNIIIVHPTGIDILEPETHHLIYYDNEVGVGDLNANLNATCRDRDNNIWIAGQKKLIKYTPLKENLEIHPRTFLEKVSVFLEPVDFNVISQFDHNQNNLVFDYLGIWYTDPSKVKYRYLLEGYDLDWIYTSDNRVVYSNIPPGNYTFKVMSTENDAFSDEPITSYSFEVRPPIWQRLWFILTLIVVGILLFRLYQTQRDTRVQKVNLLRKERAESQLNAIKAQINPHFLFNSFNTLIAIIEEDPKVAVEYVENLSDFYRSILQYRDKEVIALQEELELIRKFTFLIKKRYGDGFNLDININGAPVYIAPLTLQVLIENVLKHNVISKSKPLQIHIGIEDNEYISVENNLQQKKEKQKSTSFGLQSISKRYELMGAKKVEIIKTDKIFKVKIPIIKKAK